MENFIFVLHTDHATSNDDHSNLFHSFKKDCYYGKNHLMLEKAAVSLLLSFVYLMINIPINKLNKY